VFTEHYDIAWVNCHLLVASKEIGLEVNADKTKYRSCLEIRMQDEVTV